MGATAACSCLQIRAGSRQVVPADRPSCRCVYTSAYLTMRYEWDPEKSEANLMERGFDFAFASLIFDGPTLEKQDRRQDYGEFRVVAIGLADEIALTVVYTDRADEGDPRIRRIISARRSNRRERKAYQTAIEEAE